MQKMWKMHYHDFLQKIVFQCKLCKNAICDNSPMREICKKSKKCEKNKKCEKSKICEKSEICKKFLQFLALKKQEIAKISHFSWNFLNFLHLSFYARIFHAMQKKSEMRYARNAKNSRNNALREILFLAINCMQDICEKIEKFEKCYNYCTCLIRGTTVFESIFVLVMFFFKWGRSLTAIVSYYFRSNPSALILQINFLVFYRFTFSLNSQRVPNTHFSSKISFKL